MLNHFFTLLRSLIKIPSYQKHNLLMIMSKMIPITLIDSTIVAATITAIMYEIARVGIPCEAAKSRSKATNITCFNHTAAPIISNKQRTPSAATRRETTQTAPSARAGRSTRNDSFVATSRRCIGWTTRWCAPLEVRQTASPRAACAALRPWWMVRGCAGSMPQ